MGRFTARPQEEAVEHAVAAPAWFFTPGPHLFTGGSDGAVPLFGDLVFDQAGNLYGTAAAGGITSGNCSPAGGCGVVFELTPTHGGWTETVLHSFNLDGSDGYSPNSGVIFDSSGNLFGTTVYGGADNAGAVYELTPSGSG